MARLSERGLLAAACVTIVLLCLRVLIGRPLAALRRPESRPDAGAAEWWDETLDQQLRRRIGAIESNLANVWEVLNGRNADR